MPTIADTFALVERLHAGQEDGIGEPYMNHLTAVWGAVAGRDDDVQHAALLHDAVEDGKTTLRDLAFAGYSERTLEIVDAVTRRLRRNLADLERDETYHDFIERVAAADVDAIDVKDADLAHNTDPRRVAALQAADPDRAASLAKRYERAQARLSEARAALG